MSLLKLNLLIGFISISLSTHGNIIIQEEQSGADRFWIISDTEFSEYSQNLIVFLHGYGASNPACYGGWIRNLVEQGNIVVFPKFQTGLWLPRTTVFQERVDKSVRQSIQVIKNRFNHHITSLTFITHSIGGIIASNLADEYGFTGAYDVAGLILVQPGFKYHPLGKQSKYKYIDPNTKVIMITGDRDITAGDKFAHHFYQKTPQIRQKVLLEHPKTSYGTEVLSSDHKEPISPDFGLDTHNRNLVILGALYICGTDQVDKSAYWRLSNLMVDCINSGIDCHEHFSNEDLLTYMGKWKDNSPVKPMKLLLGPG